MSGHSLHSLLHNILINPFAPHALLFDLVVRDTLLVELLVGRALLTDRIVHSTLLVDEIVLEFFCRTRRSLLIDRFGLVERFGLITLSNITFASVSMSCCWLADLLIGPPTAFPLLGTGVPWVSLPGPTGVMTHPGRMMSHQSANPILLLCTGVLLRCTELS